MSTIKPPLPNCYWVMPERLLAGEHPAGNDASETRARLVLLGGACINYFVDLTEQGEMPEYRALLPRQSHYLHFPIRDMAVPADVGEMLLLLARIERALALGRRIYVHCRMGIGRTGLVVGCFLAERGATGPAALATLNELWLSSERAKRWPTVPQTDEQADFIRLWHRHARPHG
jgi:protein-tyrosine phosphatase